MSASTAKEVLTCLLNVDPSLRMSPTQLLEHPWITVGFVQNASINFKYVTQ